jgi:hypothetical protein
MDQRYVSDVIHDQIAQTYLNKMVEPASNKCTHHRSKPVDPVIASERRRSHTRTKATRRVHRCTGVVDAGDMNYEERKANTDRRDERVFRLLGRKHEDCKDEVGSQELAEQKLAS